MSNDSSTGGYLAQSSGPIEGIPLQDFLQAVLVGITGLPGANVRPGWQPEPPNIPANQDWAAYRITERKPESPAAYVSHSAAGQGSDTLIRHEVLTMLVSFYGPDADSYAEGLRDGLLIDQNREVLQVNGMALVETGEMVTAPTLLKDVWLYRVDMTVKIRRVVQRVYPVLNLLSATACLSVDKGNGTPFSNPINI